MGLGEDAGEDEMELDEGTGCRTLEGMGTVFGGEHESSRFS